MSAKILGKTELYSAKWLKLSAIKYQDEQQRERIWETLERTTHGADRIVDGIFWLMLMNNAF